MVTLFLAEELFAQRRLRRDDENLLFVVQHFRAAGARADEVKEILPAILQFHQRAETDGIVRAKFFHAQLFKLGDGRLEFRRLPGLAAREVGGFEAARVVFALGLARLVRGLGAGELRGAEVNFQLARELGGDFLDEGAFVQSEFYDK